MEALIGAALCVIAMLLREVLAHRERLENARERSELLNRLQHPEHRPYVTPIVKELPRPQPVPPADDTDAADEWDLVGMVTDPRDDA